MVGYSQVALWKEWWGGLLGKRLRDARHFDPDALFRSAGTDPQQVHLFLSSFVAPSS